MRLRPYEPEDLDILLALFTDAVRRIACRDYTEAQTRAWAPEEPDRAVWATQLLSTDTLVAEEQSEIVGFASWEPNGHIDLLYVHADHQRRGVARALVTAIENEAYRRGLSRLLTEASLTARAVFERCGFLIVTQQTVVLRGETFVNFRMEKVLP